MLCGSQAEAQRALETLGAWVATNGLSLHPNKTRLVDASQPGGFDFRGYHFERGMRWPRAKSLKQLKATLRQKTRRSQGRSLKAICADLNGTLRGWFEYFKHSHYTAFEPIDQYTRGRLRSILRKRHGKKGRGRGLDHQRWPNAYFTALGLFALKPAHAAARQSSGR